MIEGKHRLHHLQQGDAAQEDHPTRRSHEDAKHAISTHCTCWGRRRCERMIDETRSKQAHWMQLRHEHVEVSKVEGGG